MLYFIRFTLSAFIYGISTVCTGMIFVIPSEIVSLSIFLAPMLGFMWGPVAAVGVCVGGLVVTPVFHDVISSFSGDFAELLPLSSTVVWLFFATYLPYFLWHNWNNWKMPPHSFNLSTETLKKFIAVLFVTFAITSLLRTIMVSEQDLQATLGFFGFVKSNAVLSYITVCFLNDFTITIFLDLFLFFFLISRGYPFHNSQEEVKANSDTPHKQINHEEFRILMIAAISYLILPALVAHLDIYQIYGMDNLETWMTFILRCMILIDAYIVMITYLMFRYRRSIMLEIVFLVATIIFISTAVLGWGSSLAMAKMVKRNVDDSLDAMSVICRERLNRTFFCTRQAVKGMENQALKFIESYDRFVSDEKYRENHLAAMQKTFDSIATDTDGCFAYYLRLNPEIAGPKGGFSMTRTNKHWEGKLAPFVKRETIDLSLYSPDDSEKVALYYAPVKSKSATWIEPYIDPISNSYVISYVAPLYLEDRLIGLIGMDIDFNFIIQELRRMSIYDYGHVYITNRNGIVLYHRDEPQGTQFQPNPDFQEIKIYLSNGMWLGIAVPLSEVYKARNDVIMYLVASILLVAMLVSLGSVILVSHAIRPLAGMTEAAKRIASGDLNVQISYDSGNELGILVSSIREMASKLEGYIYRDKLTGLRNAAAYMSKANELNEKGKLIPDLAYAVILFDVNFLKKVNDKHGHQAGNQLLRHASRVICRVFKHSPVYRVGGDEFIAVLEGEDYENRNVLLCLFDEMIEEESFEIAGEVINVSVARGVGIYRHGMAFADVAKKADSEMYIHKSAIKAKYGEEVR